VPPLQTSEPPDERIQEILGALPDDQNCGET